MDERGRQRGGHRSAQLRADVLPAGHQRGIDRLQQPTPPLDLVCGRDHRLRAEADRHGIERCSRAITRAAERSRSATASLSTGAASRSNSGSTEVPSRNDITNSGGTSGGSPASSSSTSGTGTAEGPSARMTLACRRTSRFSVGGHAGRRHLDDHPPPVESPGERHARRPSRQGAQPGHAERQPAGPTGRRTAEPSAQPSDLAQERLGVGDAARHRLRVAGAQPEHGLGDELDVLGVGLGEVEGSRPRASPPGWTGRRR